MNEKKYGLDLKTRLAFYLGGCAFASLSYLMGFLLYQREIEASGGSSYTPSVTGILLCILDDHIVSFLLWQIVCLGLAVIIGAIYGKEVVSRQQAEDQANIDGLTGVYNHRYFQDRLRTEIERAGRYNRELSIIMFDLDNFKAYNDTWGHQDGDKLLRWFAALCKRCIRHIDLVARYGGEEFVIILPETAQDGALQVAERIRELTEKDSLTRFGKNKGVTVSAGVGSFPEHGTTRYSLVLNADAALYFAKMRGKNRCFIYQEEQHKGYRANSGHIQVLPWDDDMSVIEALGAVADEKDSHLRGHCATVTRLCVLLGEKMGFTASELNGLRAAALLHDIGKIVTPQEILAKPGPLEDEEWQKVEDHARLGARMLKRVQQLGSIIPAVKHHHERYDGCGYPNGLAGENIPLMARIIAVADAYDAMTNNRSYRQAMTGQEALMELKRCAGSQFDPQVVDAFVDIVCQEQKNSAA